MVIVAHHGISLKLLATSLSVLSLAGCVSLPPLTLRGKPNSDAPAGPKVASLIANLKCELWDAANSDKALTFYKDDLLFETDEIAGVKNHVNSSSDARAFNLRNIFSEVEFVGEATFTLDVTQTGGFNPSASLSKYYRAMNGVLPATGAVLTVGGQLSEAAHRYLTLYSSADFSRLVASEDNPFVTDAANPSGGARRPQPLAPRPTACDRGMELQGRLGIKESLASGIQAATMNDIAVYPSGGAPGVGANAVVPVPSTYPVGQISGQVDFTIVEGLNGGPTWNLLFFKGPGGNSAGLFNYQRQVKDTLVFTFIPVCIRSHYWTNSVVPPFRYFPEMVDGTPGWANYLPLCDSAYHLQQQASALTAAKNNNDQILLQTSPLFRPLPQ